MQVEPWLILCDTGVDYYQNVDCSMSQRYLLCCVRVNSMVKLLRAHGGCLGRNRR
jgi:hypothetical protein